MATLAVQEITPDGLDPTLSAADAGGDEFSQQVANVFLYVNNGGGSSIDVTVTAQNTTLDVRNWGELDAADIVVSVPAGEFRMIGPFYPGPYTRTPQISYTDVTSVTVAAIKLQD